MHCLRCGNREERFFYYDGSAWYCRKCIAFGRVDVNTLPKVHVNRGVKVACDYQLKYPLTEKQRIASKQIVEYSKRGISTLVYAVCGAGKTELVMEVIKQCLNEGKKIGFAISRRQVVLEIAQRMRQAFPMIQVVEVCEGFLQKVDGDLIVCTMHQLYRYPSTFDVLIMDEVDAFPYRGNELLQAMAHYACKGSMIYLTATPDEQLLQEVKEGRLELVTLFQRPHGYPLIEPEVLVYPIWAQYVYLIHFLWKQRKLGIQTLVFVPTIALANALSKWLSLFFSCVSFTSKSEEKEVIIDEFHAKKYECLITTTILERGITIKGIYIIVLQADHIVFNEASLTQMIGRVGRSIEMPTGKGIFLCRKKSKDVMRCKEAIHKINEDL